MCAGFESTPLVSVVIPSYNAQLYIDQCLSSVVNQSYQNLEVIVVDDGSTDKTLDVVGRYEDDPRVSVISQSNQFAGVARNVGMDHSRGKYILFLDADDFFSLDMVEKLVARAEQTDSEIVICRSEFYDDITAETSPIDFALTLVDVDKIYTADMLKNEMFRFCNGWAWDKLFLRSFVDKNSLRFQALRTSNDAYFVFMAAMLAERISFVPDCLVRHRTNNSCSLERTRSQSWRNAFEAACLIRTEMNARKIYPTFERSFVNWFLDFAVWNYRTLEESLRCEVYDCLVDLVVPLLPDNYEGFYYRERNERIAIALRECPRNLAQYFVDMICEYEEQIDRCYRQLRCALEEKDAYHARGEKLDSEITALRQSTSYRVGRALTALPRMVKGATASR